MNKIKSFVFSEKRLSKAIFGFLILAAFALIFGPNVYAQFARQDGPTGWGYGNGYGYGYGYGFDYGTISGYKTTFGSSAKNVYGYGYGYGYLDTGVTYNASTGYSVTPANMANLVQSGVMVPNGTNIASTTMVSFTNKVTMTVATGTTISIPSGTTFTSSSTGNFATLAASDTVTSLSSEIDSAGAISFGVPNLDLTVNPAITLTINVGSAYDTKTLKIYRRDAAGTWADTGSTCVVASGLCSFTTTHLSSFDTGNKCSTVTNGSGGTYPSCNITCNSGYSLSGSTCVANSSGGGGGIAPSAIMCTNVTYGAYSTACFGSFNFRPILTRSPNNCTLTAEQQAGSQRTCATGSIIVPVTDVTGEGLTMEAENTANFIAREKNLVKKINKALAKRLAGRILLQVQEHGEAWYINPLDGAKYFLGRPADAFALMRKLALGISNKDFATYKNNMAPARLAGRILLKVQDSGKAYYVNPVDLKMHYLGRPADAFSVMRGLGLGITDDNLRQIEVKEVK